jgi:hypothetical protein
MGMAVIGSLLGHDRKTARKIPGEGACDSALCAVRRGHGGGGVGCWLGVWARRRLVPLCRTTVRDEKGMGALPNGMLEPDSLNPKCEMRPGS